MDPIAIYALVDDVLGACQEALNLVLPTDLQHQRVGVVNGPPAIDGWDGACIEHLVGWAELGNATEDFPAPLGKAVLCRPPATALQVAVQVVRCEPTISDAGEFPPIEDLGAAARLLYVEAWTIWNALTDWCLNNGDAANETDHVEAVLGSLIAVPPQGAVAGWEARLILDVDACAPFLYDGNPALPDGFLPT